MLIWQRPDLMHQLLPNVDLEEVQTLREEADKLLEIEKFQKMARAIELLPTSEQLTGPLHFDLNQDHVSIGQRSNLSESQFATLRKAIEALHPWRKGPFELFGLKIDTEWRSNLKWDRVSEAVGDLSGRDILDVGCGNGLLHVSRGGRNYLVWL